MAYKLLLVILIAGLVTVHTDADFVNLKRIGWQQTITCYSGGIKVFSDTSTGVTQPSHSGIYYMSKSTGKFMQVYMDCVVEDLTDK